ncbi:MAG: MFS transporter [Sphingomonadales bacterium CG12_big_fil_rev_8_21_14_0_65_65_10]|jgi:proton-dependent oligopeptide transporter, POT family|uniref:MFS transporter n=1 Tax=Blastomonas marina TaxID=1867408 RepID=A0ABQ1F1Q5_9SPHN|nr:peptide MFS transporter [Blastomonas marina]PIW56025.1 MAG: MFS transporter [Sphingomonadales bacterium CG12_big_fil_rev_8_21_14_0_65_65_10]WPZ03716.1 peptide MFS transporter [Blastomonas marina]GFZ97046.1 MFS transporter [Blastomonas marina]
MKDIGLWQEADWIAAIAAVVLSLFLIAGAFAVTRKQPEVGGHPKGLYILFFAEMWERFSYYGMRALLIFYLTQHWLYNDSRSNIIYGAYVSLVYITPVLGGWIADRYLGQRKAVLFGAVLLTLGHFFMAFEGDGALGQDNPMISVFWLALSLIIVGSGFLKANISVIVGQLYPRTDVRRDGAYTIFYMGINVGAAIGTILAGYLGVTLGWAYGFGAAGLGMLLGLVVFVLGKPLLLGQGEPPKPLSKNTEYTMYGIGLVGVVIMWFLIQYQSVVGGLMLVSGIALLGYVLVEAFRLEKEPRERMFAILFLIALQPLFWGLFEQAGGSLNLFTDRYIDLGGVPAPIFQSINPIYIILLAPVFAGLWTFLGKRGLEPSTPAKFGLGLVQLGFGFLVLVWGAATVGVDAKIPVLFLFGIYLFHTTGELCLSPVGLSAMNRLAPRHLASLIMGAWFFATAGGNYVAGMIGAATGGEDGEMTREATLSIYQQIGWVAIGVGVFVILIARFVKKLMHLETLADDEVGDDLLGQSEGPGEAQGAGIHPAVDPNRS